MAIGTWVGGLVFDQYQKFKCISQWCIVHSRLFVITSFISTSMHKLHSCLLIIHQPVAVFTFVLSVTLGKNLAKLDLIQFLHLLSQISFIFFLYLVNISIVCCCVLERGDAKQKLKLIICLSQDRNKLRKYEIFISNLTNGYRDHILSRLACQRSVTQNIFGSINI